MKLFPLNLTKDTEELKRMITENPDLPIVVIAGSEANTGEVSTMYCADIRFSVGEILDCEVPYTECVETDRDNFAEQIEEWLWDEMCGNDKDSRLSEVLFEEALQEEKAKYEPYWKNGMRGRSIYLTEREQISLIKRANSWYDMMVEGEDTLDDAVNMMDNGLGSALKKLYVGRNGWEAYKEYK